MAIEVKMPRLSDTMEVGTVVKWNVKPGQKVKSGDVIADIETDKATMELQTFDDGTVAQLAVDEGTSVKVGTVIMRLAESGEAVDAAQGGKAAEAPAGAESGKAGRAEVGSQTESPKSPPTGSATAVTEERRVQDRRQTADGTPSPAANGRAPAEGSERVFASPLARKIAGESGVDLHEVQGSGPSGRIVKRDVEAAMGGGGAGAPVARQAQPGPRAPVSRETAKISSLSAGAVPGVALPPAGAALTKRTIALSNMRATIAKRLVQSKTTIPHYQVTVAVRMDSLLNLRQQLNDQLASHGVKLSVNDFLVRACALAMHQHPHVNSRWIDVSGPGVPPGNPSIELIPDINIGIAIALPLNDKGEGGGLVVATLRNADRLGLRMISGESKRLSEKARGLTGKGGLSIEEMADSTFTISNLGMFGVEHFTAIINPPNAAILAVGAAVEQPVVETDRATGEKKLGIGHIMQMTMSSDHRIVDGAMAAQYLATVKDLLEKPAALLV
jgi:pyruvate dehydrogenase E2 component (dihydrolipoamide acetyltransferase)